MRRLTAFGILAALTLAAVVSPRADADMPDWAYAIPPDPVPGTRATPPPADRSLKSLPGTSRQFTLQQISDGYGPADWFPEDHPTMPDIVAHGKRPGARACSLCHMPNGFGRQENSGVSSLPVSYFVNQMNDYRSGLRKSADPRKANTIAMVEIAKALTPEEILESAEYFAAIKLKPWIRVVETTRVAKMESHGGIWVPVEGAGAGTEPIGLRIIETPEEVERTERLRDPHSGFIAYVPVGSIRKGEQLARTGGNGKTIECALCHGADLLGLGPVPGIAGRSPSYLVRQMYDMEVGARNGEWTQLMKAAVAKLTTEDLVDIAAYVASLPVDPR